MPLSDVTVWSSVEIFTGLQPLMRQVKTDYIRKTHSHVTSHICTWSLTADYFFTFGFSQVASVSRNNNCVRAFKRCPQQSRRTEGLKLVERVRTFMWVLGGGGYLLGTIFHIEEQGLWCAHGDILVFRSPLHRERRVTKCQAAGWGNNLQHLSKVLRKDDALSAATLARINTIFTWLVVN